MTILNEVQSVQTRTFTFESAGSDISGTLYLPAGHDGSVLPGVVVTGAWTTVEEQMPRTYAIELAARGFAALTFDFRGWGKSGDLPGGRRYVESPAAKIGDIRAAIAFAAGLPEVDERRLHGLGICASSGYMIDAVVGNAAVAKVALVAPWLQTGEIVAAVYGGPEGVAALIGSSAAPEIIPAAGPEGAEGVLMPIGGYYFDPDRGAIPTYDNKWNTESWAEWLTYVPAENPGRLDKALALVHSDAAAIPEGARAFASDASAPVDQHWLADVTQFDFYDRPDAVTRAADIVADHFLR